MLSRLNTQLHEIRLELHGRWLRRQERLALRRLGEELASRTNGAGHEALDGLVAEVRKRARQLDSLSAEIEASLAADRVDLGRVAAWVRPVVVARGMCTRVILRHRLGVARRAIEPRHEALGELVADGRFAAPRGDVLSARVGLKRLLGERETRLAPFGGSAHPAWVRRVVTESLGLAGALVHQLRSALMPKAPALAGMAAGWWIANTYTDSHLRSVLRSVGVGSGGTHVVSGSTYKAMTFWLPLLAAAACAYLGERIAGYYRGRTAPRDEAAEPEAERGAA